MILVDMNQVTLSNLMIQIGRNTEVDPDMVRHMVLNSLRGYRNRFNEEFGELVLCYDNKGNWRREYFPNYKHGRRKDRKASSLDWGAIFDTLHLIKQELQDNFPYKVLEVKSAEADDIIASVVKYVSESPSHYEKVLIVSGDKDFIQLQKHSFVTQYSPVLKKFVNGIDPEVYIKEHILKGDRSDGVPNFLSSDDCFVNEMRQRPISKKKLSIWIDLDPEDFCNEEMLRNYQRNRTLIDLEYAPKEIHEACVNTYLNSTVNDRSGLLNYFIKHRLKNHMDKIGEF